jgi:hypothetical protein
MSLKTAFSTNSDPAAAALEVANALRSETPKLLLFFASPALDPEVVGRTLRAELGPVPSLGCTTAGELAAGRMLKRSLVGAVFDSTLLDRAEVGLVRDMSSPASTNEALDSLAARFGRTPQGLDPTRHVGLVLHDGLSVREEDVMSALSARTNVPFVGGSAGDDLAFRATRVFVDGVPSSGASALALIEPKRSFKILKTQSFDVLDIKLKVTSGDPSTRTVHTFNDRPASEEYARALGVTPSELESRFQSSPLGLVVPGGEPFVRSPLRVQGGSVVFYCQIPEGGELSVLRARDIVSDTRRDFQAAVEELGSLTAVVNFHCILRTIELEQRGQTEAYGALFEGVPGIGFSTYGESYIGHINQTSTMLLLA